MEEKKHKKMDTTPYKLGPEENLNKEKEFGERPSRLRRYMEKLRSAAEKPLELYMKAYSKHPTLTLAMTYLSVGAGLSALGAYVGHELLGFEKMTVGEPAHWEDVYEYVRVPSNPMIPCYKAVKIGEKWVESTLRDFYSPMGAFVGGAAGFITSAFAIPRLDRLMERYKRKKDSEKR